MKGSAGDRVVCDVPGTSGVDATDRHPVVRPVGYPTARAMQAVVAPIAVAMPAIERRRFTTPLAFAVPQQLRSNRATLTVLSGPRAGRCFTLLSEEVSIGRDPSSTVHLDDLALSRAHARIRRLPDGSFAIRDLGSTNGTFVRAVRVDEVRLRRGDHIQLGPHVLLRFDMVDDLEQGLRQRMYEASTSDPLLEGVLNRRSFLDVLTAELASARSTGSELSLLMIDVDHFKHVNDSLGHAAGDRVLRAIAERIVRVIRADDTFGRYGGEELLVLARNTAHADAMRLAERLRIGVETMPAEASVTISIGVASRGELERDHAEELVTLADRRMYGAKEAGRNRVCGL